MNHNQSFARIENVVDNEAQHKVYLNMSDLQKDNNQKIHVDEMPLSKIETQPLNSALDNNTVSPPQLQPTPESTLLLPDNTEPQQTAPATHT